MILTGAAISEAVAVGDIVIQPFEPAHVGPNSYDFRLGNRCLTYSDRVLDSAVSNATQCQVVPQSGLLLEPGRLYLFNTEETMGSTKYVPIIRGRSSLARLGVFINITADLIDIGSINQWTLQLHAVTPTRVYPGMLIGQVTFWRTQGPVELYSGKYQDRPSPVASLLYMDFAAQRSADGEG